jgi:hypothetical protein
LPDLSLDRLPAWVETKRAAPTLGDASSVERIALVVGDNSAASFKDYADFAGRGRIYYSPEMRIYGIAGRPGTTIAVPTQPPDYQRLGPEEALAKLDQLPDLRLVRRLVIVDRPHAEEPWFRQTVSPTWRLLAEAMRDGEIRMYRPAAGEDIATTLAHEWSHLLEWAYPNAAHMFELARGLEQLDAGAVPPLSLAEEWAGIGDRLLSAAPMLAPLTANANPVRACIWLTALEDCLAKVPKDQRGGRHREHLAWIWFARTNLFPEAINALEGWTAAQDVERAVQARLILRYLSVWKL